MRYFLSSLLLLGLASCASQDLTVRESKYLKVEGAGLMRHGNKPPERYVALLTLKPGTPVPAYLSVTFGDPTHPGKPLKESTDIFRGTGQTIMIFSPKFSSLPPAGTLNTVAATIFSDPKMKRKLDGVTQNFAVKSPLKPLP